MNDHVLDEVRRWVQTARESEALAVKAAWDYQQLDERAYVPACISMTAWLMSAAYMIAWVTPAGGNHG